MRQAVDTAHRDLPVAHNAVGVPVRSPAMPIAFFSITSGRTL